MAIKKYRKKPVEIQAIQFDGNNADEVKAFAGNAAIESGGALRIQSQEGARTLQIGDYVVRGVSGEFFASTPESFLQNNVHVSGNVYRKPLREVAACYYEGDNYPEIVAFTFFNPARMAQAFNQTDKSCIIPRPGREPYICHVGDYVIRNGDSVYPCDAKIFAETYNPIDSDTP